MCILQDSQDPNPLIRALAVRTMGCIRVDKITEYLCDPLQRCIKDEDPYVRKTAAVCIAKLHDINPELVEDRGFLDALKVCCLGWPGDVASRLAGIQCSVLILAHSLGRICCLGAFLSLNTLSSRFSLCLDTGHDW
jgi:hypothetical protein